MVTRRASLLLWLGATGGCLTPVPSYCLTDADCDGGVCGPDFACTAALAPDAGDAGRHADAGVDAGLDAGPDAGPGIDAGPDAGPDAGFDAGLDAGLDAGPDAGFDAGCQPLQDPAGGIQPRGSFAVAAVGQDLWLAGGLDSCGNTLADIEVYSTSLFSSAHMDGGLFNPRSGLTAASMPDGDGGAVLFFINGYNPLDDLVRTVTSCDSRACQNGDARLPPLWYRPPSTRAWSAAVSVPVGVVESLDPYSGPDTLVLLLGGETYAVHSPCGTLEVFDPNGVPVPFVPQSIGGWAALAHGLPTPRAFLGAALGPDGQVYAVGGVDDAGNALGTTEALNASPFCLQADGALNDGGSLLVDGGDGGAPSPCAAWTEEAPLAQPRWDLAVVAGPDGLIYAIGGLDADGGASNAVETYSTATASWSAGPPLNVARHGHGAAVTDAGLIWVLGGFAADGGALSAVEVYDPALDGGWTRLSP